MLEYIIYRTTLMKKYFEEIDEGVANIIKEMLPSTFGIVVLENTILLRLLFLGKKEMLCNNKT